MPRVLLLAMMTFFTTYAFAVQEAIVVVPRAVIYADTEMAAKLGYLSRGQKLQVGEVPRNNGTLLPIVISGRIAYIQVKDVETVFEQTVSKRRQELKVLDREALNHYEINTGLLASTSVLKASNAPVGASEKSMSLTSLNINLSRVYEATGNIYSVGLEYTLGRANSENLTLMGLSAGYAKRVATREYIDLDLLISVDYYPRAQYEYVDNFRINGQGLGYQVGTKLTYAASKKTSVSFDLRYAHSQFSGFELPVTGSQDASFSPSLDGLKYGIYFNYLF